MVVLQWIDLDHSSFLLISSELFTGIDIDMYNIAEHNFDVMQK